MKKMAAYLLLFSVLLSACGSDGSNDGDSGGDSSDPGALTVALSADRTGGAAPLEVNFTAAVPDGGNEIGYLWDFGTGQTAQGSPSRAYVFEQAGAFTVDVTASRNGQTATKSIDISVLEPQVVPENGNPSVTLNVSRKTGRAPLEVEFSAAATDPDGDPLSYRWNFGDGETASGAGARHTFTDAGAYTATVTVSDGRGGTAQAETRLAVTNPDPELPPPDLPVPTDLPAAPAPENRAPEVSLSADPTEGVVPLTVSLGASASDPDGDTLTYTWSFGNGEAASGNSSRTLTYTEPGSYTAAVTVSDGLTETSAETQIIVEEPVVAPPENAPPAEVTAVADPPSGTTPLQVEFSASATDADGDTLVYLWDFGDGVISGENPARHTYQTPGTYSASVTVGDRKGGKTREEVVVEVTGGGADTPDVPFYGEWAWAARSESETFEGYLSISQASSSDDSGLEDFFIRGGKGAWTLCEGGLGEAEPEACSAPNGVGRIDTLDFGDGETYDIVFADESGNEVLIAFDDDDRIGNENGAPTFRGGGAWYEDDGSSDDLSFVMVKVGDTPQTTLASALSALR